MTLTSEAYATDVLGSVKSDCMICLEPTAHESGVCNDCTDIDDTVPVEAYISEDEAECGHESLDVFTDDYDDDIAA